MGKINTIIFDLDGTLVDSYPAAIKSTTEALSDFGLQVSDADVRGQFGGGSRKLLWYFLDRSLRQDKASELIEKAIQRRLELQLSFTDRVTLLPNVKQLLESLRIDGFRIALATMSSGPVVQNIMNFHLVLFCFYIHQQLMYQKKECHMEKLRPIGIFHYFF